MKKLSPEAIKRLFRRHDVKEIIVAELQLSPDNGVRTVRRMIKHNKPNGKLTATEIVNILCKELKMTKTELLITEKRGTPVKIGDNRT